MNGVTLTYRPANTIQLVPGFALGGKSCTCGAGCTSTDRNTFGKTILAIEAVRHATHDTIDGTNVGQVDDAIASLTGVDDLSTGWWNWKRIDHAIGNGKGFLAAIRYRQVHRFGLRQVAANAWQRDLVWGSELFGSSPDDWHAETWTEWLAAGAETEYRGKQLRAPGHERGLIVLDPLCDGRRHTVADGAVVYPESLVLAIVADSLMGNGKLYGALTLDARYTVSTPIDPPPGVPKRTLRYGATAIHRRLRAAKPAYLRSSPRRNPHDPARNRVRWVPKGHRFEAWQETELGTPIDHNRRWYGNRAGDLWLPAGKVEAA